MQLGVSAKSIYEGDKKRRNLLGEKNISICRKIRSFSSLLFKLIDEGRSSELSALKKIIAKNRKKYVGDGRACENGIVMTDMLLIHLKEESEKIIQQHPDSEDVHRDAKRVLHYIYSIGELVNYACVENVRLISSIARRYAKANGQFNSERYDELMSEGFFGLRKAFFYYSDAGHAFGTYAVWWIRHHIVKAVQSQFRMIRLPAHMEEEISRHNRARKVLMQRLGRLPVAEEIAGELNINQERLIFIESIPGKPTSLNMPMGSEEDAGMLEEVIFFEMQEKISENSPENNAEKEELRTIIRKCIWELPNERERRIIMDRFGFSGKEKTLEEIGCEFNISRERIRQIERKSLQLLKIKILRKTR